MWITLNSVDPDEMQHHAAFHLCLHCLQKHSFRDFPECKGLIRIGAGGIQIKNMF